MQTRAAEELRLVGVEDAVREVLAGVEGGAEQLDELLLLLERLRLVGRPPHPGLQGLQAPGGPPPSKRGIPRGLAAGEEARPLDQKRCTARLVAADDEPRRLDPIRSGRPLPAHATRPTRTQPLCPPRPIAFERATSTCTWRASFGT